MGMTIKKKAKSKAGRPKGKSQSYVELGLRVTKAEYDLIQQATEKNAERRHVIASRNNFCLRAAVAAAKKELGLVDDLSEA
jgi:uncharacterized protein (DUF1778 family)